MSIFGDALDFFGLGDTATAIGDTVGDIFTGVSGIYDALGGDTVWNTIRDLAGSGLNLYAAQGAADAALKSGQSSAEVSFSNAELFRTEAENVAGRAHDALIMARYNGLKLLGKQNASYAKAGVTLEGSPLIVIKETRDLIETEIVNMQKQSQNTIDNLNARAAIEDKRGQNAIDEGAFKAEAVMTNSVINSGKSLLGI